MLQILVPDQLNAESLDLFADARANEGVELVLKFFERRMGIKLGVTGRKSREEFQNIIFVHAAVLEKAEGDLGMPDFFLA